MKNYSLNLLLIIGVGNLIHAFGLKVRSDSAVDSTDQVKLISNNLRIRPSEHPCAYDLQSLCSSSSPTSAEEIFAARMCLKTNQQSLSPKCSNFLEVQSPSIVEPCFDHIKSFCGAKVVGEQSVYDCLRSHFQDLTVRCANALSDNASPKSLISSDQVRSEVAFKSMFNMLDSLFSRGQSMPQQSSLTGGSAISMHGSQAAGTLVTRTTTQNEDGSLTITTTSSSLNPRDGVTPCNQRGTAPQFEGVEGSLLGRFVSLFQFPSLAMSNLVPIMLVQRWADDDNSESDGNSQGDEGDNNEQEDHYYTPSNDYYEIGEYEDDQVFEEASTDLKRRQSIPLPPPGHRDPTSLDASAVDKSSLLSTISRSLSNVGSYLYAQLKPAIARGSGTD